MESEEVEYQSFTPKDSVVESVATELERRKEKGKLSYEGHLQSKSKRSRRQYCSCVLGRLGTKHSTKD